MTITSFQASNFKKLTAVAISPDGAVTVLSGDNGAGKSSILDGIEATLTGKDALPEKPIRDGATKGHTETVLSISELAAANNYQVWMEDARSADPTAIVIEDGHVKQGKEILACSK